MVYLAYTGNHCGEIGSAYLFSSLPCVFVFRFVLRFSIHLIPFLALNLCVRRGLKAQIAKSKQDKSWWTVLCFENPKWIYSFFKKGGNDGVHCKRLIGWKWWGKKKENSIFTKVALIYPCFQDFSYVSSAIMMEFLCSSNNEWWKKKEGKRSRFFKSMHWFMFVIFVFRLVFFFYWHYMMELVWFRAKTNTVFLPRFFSSRNG